MKHPLRIFLALLASLFLSQSVAAGPWSSADLDRDGYENRDDFDMDGDDLPDKFEDENGFSHLNKFDGRADFDGDGFTNAEEYRAVTDLNDAADNPDTKPGLVMQKLFPETGDDSEYMGTSVAIQGDVLVAGAILGDFEVGGGGAGNALVYTRQADGLWQLAQILYPDADTSDKNFGIDVDLDGDTLLVGANREDMAAEVAGAAYVYALESGVWQQQAKLSHADADVSDYFGYQVAIAGDQALISCPYCLDGRGAVYVYNRNGGNWTLDDVLTNCSADRICTFGISVSVDGDRAVISAPHYNTALEPGTAYVYERSNGVWQQTGEINSTMTLEPAYFGSRTAISGDTIIVADFWEEWGGKGHGNAYEFVLENGEWVEKSMFYAPDYTTSVVGQAVAIKGDRVLISGRTDEPSSYRGVVLVLDRNDGAWSETTRVYSDAYSFNHDKFGTALAIDVSGEQAIAGAHWDRDTTDYGGAVYVIDLQ